MSIWSKENIEGIFGLREYDNFPVANEYRNRSKEFNENLRKSEKPLPEVISLTNYKKNYSTKSDILVFRYTSCKYFDKESLFEKGFLSTSLFHKFSFGKNISQPQAYWLYLDGNFDALIFIIVPKGMKCIFFPSREYEVLFPPERLLEIKSCENLIQSDKLSQLKVFLGQNRYADQVAHADHFFKNSGNDTRFNQIERVYFAEMLPEGTSDAPFGC